MDERGLLKYVLRPPIAQERIVQGPDGLVRVALKKRFSDGTFVVDLDPLQQGRASLPRRPPRPCYPCARRPRAQRCFSPSPPTRESSRPRLARGECVMDLRLASDHDHAQRLSSHESASGAPARPEETATGQCAETRHGVGRPEWGRISAPSDSQRCQRPPTRSRSHSRTECRAQGCSRSDWTASETS